MGVLLQVPPPNSIDAAVLRRLAKSLTTPILWLELPDSITDSSYSQLPLIYGLSQSEREAMDSLVHVETDSRGRASHLCRDHLKNLSSY